jgi:hypothetical protein
MLSRLITRFRSPADPPLLHILPTPSRPGFTPLERRRILATTVGGAAACASYTVRNIGSDKDPIVTAATGGSVGAVCGAVVGLGSYSTPGVGVAVIGAAGVYEGYQWVQRHRKTLN